MDRRFVSDAMRGVLAVSGVIGTWAGPRSAGTAYVMLHHHVGEATGRRAPGGSRAAGWAGSPRHGRRGPVVRRDDADRRAVGRIRVRGGRVDRGEPGRGEEIDAPGHHHGAPADLVPAPARPPSCRSTSSADIEGWQSRSGTVKINLAVDRLPVFAAHPEFDPQVYGGTIALAESLDDVEGAYQQAVAGKPAELPFADMCIPSVFDDSLAPPGQHVCRLFTQWVPIGTPTRPRRRARRVRRPGDRAGGGGRARRSPTRSSTGR